MTTCLRSTVSFGQPLFWPSSISGQPLFLAIYCFWPTIIFGQPLLWPDDNCNLWSFEGVCWELPSSENSCPWKGGSDPWFLTPFPVNPVNPVTSSWRAPMCCKRQYSGRFFRENDGQNGPWTIDHRKWTMDHSPWSIPWSRGLPPPAPPAKQGLAAPAPRRKH